jgi:hypothetical protein
MLTALKNMAVARNIECGAPENDGNAPKLNYRLMKFSVYSLTF